MQKDAAKRIDSIATEGDGEQRQTGRKRRHSPPNGAVHEASTTHSAAAAAALHAATMKRGSDEFSNGMAEQTSAPFVAKRGSDDFSGEMAVPMRLSIEPTPQHPADCRRDGTARRLLLDSEEGAPKRSSIL